MSQEQPLVSVITPTYNRSNVLRHAIDSVLRQTFTDFEHLVMGDGCSDDSGEVVASFSDSRVRFVNLERNHGEQTPANNEGFRLSRGRFIAYIHHDDLWYPDHLETALKALKDSGAGLVFTLMARVHAEGGESLGSYSPTGRYETYVDVPPSSWVLRREFLEDLGGWRLAKECYINPSQDLLRRARAAGKDMRMAPRLTVIMIPSGIRPRTYAERHHEEHDYFHGRLLEGDAFRQEQLGRIAMRHARAGISGSVAWHLSRVFHTLTRGALGRLGIDSWELFLRLRYRKTGGLVDEMRRIRGLPPLER